MSKNFPLLTGNQYCWMLCINVKRSLLGIKLKGRIVHNTSTNRLWLDQVLDGYWYIASYMSSWYRCTLYRNVWITFQNFSINFAKSLIKKYQIKKKLISCYLCNKTYSFLWKTSVLSCRKVVTPHQKICLWHKRQVSQPRL